MKLFVSDLDGSLLNDDKIVPSMFNEMINQVFNNNDYFAIATGRSYNNVAELFAPYKDKISVICENGSQLVINDKIVYSATLTKDEVKEAIEIFKNRNKGIAVLCGLKDLYRINSNNYSTSDNEELLYYYKEYKTVNNIDEIDDEIMKITICISDGVEENLYHDYDNLNPNIGISLSAFVWLDLFKNGENKGNLISLLQKHLNVKQDNTYCFGDYLNDLTMINTTKHTFAMENAHAEIKRIFTNQIGSNNDASVCKKIIELTNK